MSITFKIGCGCTVCEHVDCLMHVLCVSILCHVHFLFKFNAPTNEIGYPARHLSSLLVISAKGLIGLAWATLSGTLFLGQFIVLYITIPYPYPGTVVYFCPFLYFTSMNFLEPFKSVLFEFHYLFFLLLIIPFYLQFVPV
jgi:hypothetical protein